MSMSLSNNYMSSQTMRKIQTHLLVWSGLSFVFYVFMAFSMMKINLGTYLFIVLSNVIFFYINYSFFIPTFLFKKKVVRYLVFSGLLLSGSFFLKGYLLSSVPSAEYFDINKSSVQLIQFVSQSNAGNSAGLVLPFNVFSIFMLNTFVILYVASLSLRVIEEWRNNEKFKTQLANEKHSAELSLYRQQINPHFVFNTLNNIYSLSISNSKDVSESILKLSSILRYILYESENEILDSADELSIIDDYIQLQKLRLDNDVSLSYKVYCEPVEYKIEPLIIITLLENAFKYGVAPGCGAFIEINLVILNGKLTLTIRNKIVRELSPEKSLHSGIGLKNMKQRLELLYPDRYKYNVNINNMIYSVFLEIEL